MTFGDDFLEIKQTIGDPLRYSCAELGLSWPPPETMSLAVGLDGVIRRYQRTQFSHIADEERATMTNVCRGAVYIPLWKED